MSDILVEVEIEDSEIVVEINEIAVDISIDEPEIKLEVVGGEGKKGDKGDKGDDGEDSTVPGPPGPSAVSADPDNTAVIGSDGLIFVPISFDQATADARYINKNGDTIPGLLLIDRGAGAGVPLLQLKTNNGMTTLSSDASSYLTFSNGIVVPTLFTGGIGFTGAANVDFNNSTLSNVGKLLANGPLKAYMDYNSYPPVPDQGISLRYVNPSSGSAPQAAFQVYKDSDPTENPFLISANGYGWLKNLMPDKVTWSLEGASGQVVNVFEVKDAAGQLLFYVGAGGNAGTLNVFNAPIVRVPGIDLWNDGTIYFQAQSVSLGSIPGALKSNSPILLPGDPTEPLHAATMQFVQNMTPTLPAEIAVIHDGLGPPTPDLGADGDYYLDKSGQVLYGPKGTNAYGGPTYTIIPLDPLVSSKNTMLLGVKTKVNAPALMVGMSFYVAADNTAQDGWIFDLWDGEVSVSHAEINGVTQVGAWINVSMPPFEFEVGKIYTASLMIPATGYRTYKASWVDAQSNGPLVLCSTAEATPQGVYDNVYDGTPPSTAWQGYIPALSPIVQGIDPSVWPIALRGAQALARGEAPHSYQWGDSAKALGIGSLALGVDSSGVGALAVEPDHISLGTARQTVEIAGSLLLQGQSLIERLQMLETRIIELEAR